MSCNETMAVVSNNWFKGSVALKLSFAPAAIFFNALIIFLLRRCVLLHVNVRYLLINLSFCSTVAAAYLLVKSVVTATLISIHRPCDLATSTTTCHAHGMVFLLFKLPVLGSILGLGVERIYSTRHAEFYMKNDSSRLSKIILAAMWVFAISVAAVLFCTAPRSQTVAYCNSLLIYDATAARVVAGVLLPLEVVSLAAHVFVWRTSSHSRSFANALRTESFTLWGRLQRRHNVAITAMILPSMILHAVCWTTILAVAAAHVEVKGDPVPLIVSQYLFYVLALAHMTVHPLLCIWTCDMMRVELVKLWPCLRALSPVSTVLGGTRGANDADKHFEMLNSIWDNHKSHGGRKHYRASASTADETPLRKMSDRHYFLTPREPTTNGVRKL